MLLNSTLATAAKAQTEVVALLTLSRRCSRGREGLRCSLLAAAARLTGLVRVQGCRRGWRYSIMSRYLALKTCQSRGAVRVPPSSIRVAGTNRICSSHPCWGHLARWQCPLGILCSPRIPHTAAAAAVAVAVAAVANASQPPTTAATARNLVTAAATTAAIAPAGHSTSAISEHAQAIAAFSNNSERRCATGGASAPRQRRGGVQLPCQIANQLRGEHAQGRWGQPGHRSRAAAAVPGKRRQQQRQQQKQTPTVTRRFCSNGSSMIRSARRSQQWRVLAMFSKPCDSAAIEEGCSPERCRRDPWFCVSNREPLVMLWEPLCHETLGFFSPVHSHAMARLATTVSSTCRVWPFPSKFIEARRKK